MYNIPKSAIKEIAFKRGIYFPGLTYKELKEKIIITYPPHDFKKGDPVVWLHSQGQTPMIGIFISAFIRKKTCTPFAKIKSGKHIHIKKLNSIEHVIKTKQDNSKQL